MNSLALTISLSLAIPSLASAQASFNYSNDVSSFGVHNLIADVPNNVQGNTPHIFDSFGHLLSKTSSPMTSTTIEHKVYLGQTGQPVMRRVANGVVHFDETASIFSGNFSALVDGPLKGDVVGSNNQIKVDVVKDRASHDLSAGMWSAPGEGFRRGFELSSEQNTEYFIQDIPFWVTDAGTVTGTLNSLSRTQLGAIAGSTTNGSTSFSWTVTADTHADGVWDANPSLGGGLFSVVGSNSVSQPGVAIPVSGGAYILRVIYQSNSFYKTTFLSPISGSAAYFAYGDMLDSVDFTLDI